MIQNGIFANVSRVKRTALRDETLDEIPGIVGGHCLESEESDVEDIFNMNSMKSLLSDSPPV